MDFKSTATYLLEPERQTIAAATNQSQSCFHRRL